MTTSSTVDAEAQGRDHAGPAPAAPNVDRLSADRHWPPRWAADIADQLVDALVAVDGFGCFVYVNAAASSLLGRSRDELLGSDAFDLVHPDDRARVRTNLTALDHGARPRPGLIRFRDGESTWTRLGVSPSPIALPDGADGPGPLTAVVIRDVALQDAHWQFRAALSRGDRFHDCLVALAEGLSNEPDGTMADRPRAAAARPGPLRRDGRQRRLRRDLRRGHPRRGAGRRRPCPLRGQTGRAQHLAARLVAAVSPP